MGMSIQSLKLLQPLVHFIGPKIQIACMVHVYNDIRPQDHIRLVSLFPKYSIPDPSILNGPQNDAINLKS